MSEETNNDKGQEENLSPEEIAKRKKDLIKFYKDQIDFLKPQKEYYETLADIEEAKFRRLVAMMRVGQLMAPPEPTQGGAPDDFGQGGEGEKKERTLKKS